MTQVALVGGAHVHTPDFIKRLNDRPDIHVKFVWDHDAERARMRAETLNSQTVASVDEIWHDDDIPGVIICSETNRHEPLVLAAAAAGKHLFVEKPLGLGAEDAYKMAAAIDAAGVLFQTGYFMRGDPIHLFLKEQLAAGNFGVVSRFRHTNCHAGSLRGWFDTQWRWITDPVQAGCGAYGDLGTHSLDILLWLMGAVDSVTASVDSATARYGDCDEYGEGLLKFSNGVIGSLAAGWVDIAHPVSLILSGTEGHAHVVDNQLYFKNNNVEGADGQEAWTDLPPAWPHAFELFLNALTGQDNVPLVSAQEAAVRCSVMEAMYEAARLQTWMRPK